MTTKERPILFSGEMVRAILSGRKTQTRRPIKPQHIIWSRGCGEKDFASIGRFRDAKAYLSRWPGVLVGKARCPFGEPGDLLWVRETFARYHTLDSIHRQDGRAYDEISDGMVGYRADGFDTVDDLRRHKKLIADSSCQDVIVESRWSSPIHMPRWASRITLEVVSVRVERVQEITEEEARAEGVEPGCLTCGENCIYTGGCGCCRPCYRESFSGRWQTIYGRESWAANPWVWAVEFRRVKP